ncbi:Hypothetical protein LUCI_3403 [Lucifera butyrica]|uniref:Uncharacterized protein n=1 Tax=Lucifera butyrica TaxID=1351585 RepID=A0A498RGA5_9FIRM|nr:hypothetical protein [Lucifera butyrica]VBB08138.1 Hypothetical protein LUCI_3403 [Lucifera butyrica]
MKKSVVFLLILLSILYLPATALMAWAPNYEGEPDILNPNHISGAFVWHDYNGFHLRTTTVGDKHTFTGTIHTNGHFQNVDDRFFRDKDYYHLSDRDTVDFQFTTTGRTVGIDFDIADGDYLSLEIYMDGHKISPMDIYVGKDGWHPGKYKFTLNRLPYYYDERVVIVHPRWHGYWGWGYHHR